MAAPPLNCPDCGHGAVLLTGCVRYRFTITATGGLLCKRDPCGKDLVKTVTCETCAHVYQLSDFTDVEFIETPFWKRPKDC